MFRKLSTRLILSHILPALVLMIALGLVIFYLLETRYSFDDLVAELERQGTIILELTQDEAIWSDPTQAQQMVRRLRPPIQSRMMFLDKKGQLLASSFPSDRTRTGQLIDTPVVRRALQGKAFWEIGYNMFMQQRVLDWARPVTNKNGQVIGVLRFSHDIAEIEQPIGPLRLAVVGAILAGLGTAVIFGAVLGHSVSLPLSRLKDAVVRLAPGSTPILLPETGPDEVRTVAISHNNLVRRLQNIEAERRQLLVSIVHELGTPLGAIKAAAQALQNGAVRDPDFAGELADGIVTQVDQLVLLIDDLTLLDETSAKDLTLHRDWIDLEELVRAKCQAYTPVVRQKQIDLCFQPNMPLPSVWVDATRIRQILANLLHNAYKYTPVGGRIVVSSQIEAAVNGLSQSALIQISDTGPGIPLEEQEKIFQIRYRSPHQPKLQQGVGIGLALARRLTEAHGGTLTVQSQIGKGATFMVRLPIVTE